MSLPKKKEEPLYIRGKYTVGQKNSTKKYNAAHYDSVIFRVKKGQKERLKAAADKNGMSLNVFLVECISKYLQEDDMDLYNYVFADAEETEGE